MESKIIKRQMTFCMLIIEPASISSVLNGMEKNHLVVRKMNRENRRNYNIYLTDTGREMAMRLQGEFQTVERKAFEGFREDEKKQLLHYLNRIYHNLEVQNEK